MRGVDSADGIERLREVQAEAASIRTALEPPTARELEIRCASGIDVTKLPPREFLLGGVFARGFASSVFAEGATGKTSWRIAQALAMATGKELTGEKVYQRSRVLIVCMEDDVAELEKRIGAAMRHYGISPEETEGWLFYVTPGLAAGKLMEIDPETKQPVMSRLQPTLEKVIIDKKIDAVILDPLVKLHGVDENNNSHMNAVIQLLTEMASRLNIAMDVPHHTTKGGGDPGNSDKGRGASAVRDAIRLGYTATRMSEKEAAAFRIPEHERKQYVRVDPAKVNIVPHARTAQWFKLISVWLGNGTPTYPQGDNIQVAVPWQPPDLWAGVSEEVRARVIAEIKQGPGDGELYSDAPSAKRPRCVSEAFRRAGVPKSPADARLIVGEWIGRGQVRRVTYVQPGTRKKRQGLEVGAAPAAAEQGPDEED